MSEFASFRVDPHLSAIDNCRNNVRQNADVFVLIIGGKRGSIDPNSGKSIVNLEYEAAVAEGLDIYVFVEQSVGALLPIWKVNPDISLSPTIDSNEILIFIEKIHSEQRWTFPFSKEADISEILAIQLSGQFRELLEKRRSGHLDDASIFKNETPTAKRLVESRGKFWEYLLTAELLEPRLTRLDRRFKDVQAGRVLGQHRTLKGRGYIQWVQDKFPEIKGATDKAVAVMEQDVTSSWGPSGVPGVPAEILAAIKELETSLEALLQLESDIFRTHGPDATEPVRQALLGMSSDIFDPICTAPVKLREIVELGMAHKEGDPPINAVLNLKFVYSRGERFNQALKHMQDNIDLENW